MTARASPPLAETSIVLARRNSGEAQPGGFPGEESEVLRPCVAPPGLGDRALLIHGPVDGLPSTIGIQ